MTEALAALEHRDREVWLAHSFLLAISATQTSWESFSKDECIVSWRGLSKTLLSWILSLQIQWEEFGTFLSIL